MIKRRIPLPLLLLALPIGFAYGVFYRCGRRADARR